MVGPRPVFADDPPARAAARHSVAWKRVFLAVAELAGGALAVAGVTLVSVPAAMITGGMAVVLVVEALDRKRA